MEAVHDRSPVAILLVEDNPLDAKVTVDALEDSAVRYSVSVVADGAEALAFLRKQDPYGDAVLPHLIVLDLNLPKIDGREVLAQIKMDESLKHIPVVILTSSSAEHDIYEAYSRHANCYVAKPFDLDDYVAVAKAIHRFWLTVARLPRQASMSGKRPRGSGG